MERDELDLHPRPPVQPLHRRTPRCFPSTAVEVSEVLRHGHLMATPRILEAKTIGKLV